MIGSLESPNLDDRTFRQLVDEAIGVARRSCTAWSDFTPGDPGVTLLELFAFLTETLIYRLNRVPEKAYVEFLRLMGVRLVAPSASTVRLTFTRARAADTPLVIPRGTRVTVGRTIAHGEAPVFSTVADAVIPPGATTVEVLARDGDVIAAELLGTSTGMPGQSFAVRRAPITAPAGDELDLVIGVEATAAELADRQSALSFGGQTFAVWREVEHFGAVSPADRVYVVDRVAGRITFAPGVRGGRDGQGPPGPPLGLAATPPAGRTIRAWYRRGGGSTGNVAAHTLTVMKDPLAGVAVTNARPATGGRDPETTANAIVRGPQEFRSLDRAVTAEDFEILALRLSGAVARARAGNLAEAWAHAAPGTVDVVIVPAVPPEAAASGRVSRAMLAAQETDDVRRRIGAALDERRTLGTSCRVSWARYQTVSVHARVVVHREEDPARIQRVLLDRLHRTVNPVATDGEHSGWRFGQPLRVSTVYDLVLSEPGVKYVDDVALVVESSPAAAITSLARDAHQRRTWFAACADAVYRTTNDAEGWEQVASFGGEPVTVIETHESVAGVLAAATAIVGGDGGANLWISEDCGETWQARARLAFPVNDLAWTLREQQPVLLLATERGLYELALQEGATPLQLLVLADAADLGMSAVAVANDPRGGVTVAVAARQTRGVFASNRGGAAGTFRPLGLEGSDVSTLEVRRDGPRTFLWAGFSAEAGAEGRGCAVRELRASDDAPSAWSDAASGWQGGSCHALAFGPDFAVAATRRAGILRLSLADRAATWRPCDVNCGLPLRDVARLHPVEAVAADPAGTVIGGGPVGVYRSLDGGLTYQPRSAREQRERVTIPDDWLFCSGEHQLTVIDEDAASAGGRR